MPKQPLGGGESKKSLNEEGDFATFAGELIP